VSDGSSDEQAGPGGGLVGGAAGVRSFSSDHVQAGGFNPGAVPPVHDWQGHADPGCCNDICSLNSAVSTSADRQVACRCIKSLTCTISGLDLGAISGLPGKCGVSIPIPISRSTDYK
jgi:hypothetical protein